MARSPLPTRGRLRDLAHCADGRTEAQRGEGAHVAEGEEKEGRGAPESLEGLPVATPPPSPALVMPRHPPDPGLDPGQVVSHFR